MRAGALLRVVNRCRMDDDNSRWFFMTMLSLNFNIPCSVLRFRFASEESPEFCSVISYVCGGGDVMYTLLSMVDWVGGME